MNMQKIDLVDELMRKVIFRDDEEAFCQLFYDLFPPLCAFAHRYVEEKEICIKGYGRIYEAGIGNVFRLNTDNVLNRPYIFFKFLFKLLDQFLFL